jgi:hypothetical protein
MATTEQSGDGREGNKPGLYRHPESGAEVFVKAHPKFGSSMADGVVAQGYRWTSFEEPESLAAAGKPDEAQAAKLKQSEHAREEAEARARQLESELAELKAKDEAKNKMDEEKKETEGKAENTAPDSTKAANQPKSAAKESMNIAKANADLKAKDEAGERDATQPSEKNVNQKEGK